MLATLLKDVALTVYLIFLLIFFFTSVVLNIFTSLLGEI